MKGPLLTELPIKHLEYVFSPPGLKLPIKGESEHGTTSILVRGGAGTGKTTFALALAHALAKVGGGLVLYLTTEFSPVEIQYKATLIGLTEGVVNPWPGTEPMSPGGVVVEHLSVVRQGKPVTSSAERKRSVIDAVWGLLHSSKEEDKTPLPVRAVVIDALTLPEVGESEGGLRADLVAFVQALENEGVSVVLVEELAPVAAAWSSFVVDVMFELAFQPDPETQDLRRKLTVSKCRYALSIPGPHDYGLENGIPAVWPDIFRVVTGTHTLTELTLFHANWPRTTLPTDSEGQWATLDAPIILSPYDLTSTKAPFALERTPGVTRLMIHCGTRTTVGLPPHMLNVNEDDGVHAIGWAILSAAKTTHSNSCLFQGLEGLLPRPDSTARVSRLLEALRLMGFMVCIHSPSDTTRSLEPMADLVWGGKRSPHPLPLRRHRTFARRCVSLPWLKEDALGTQRLVEIEGATDADSLRKARENLDKVTPNAPKSLQLVTAYEWVGKKIDMGYHDDGRLLKAGGKEGHHAAWFALLTGADWHAARAALAAVESEKQAPTMLLLWKAVCAAISENRAAIDELKDSLSSPDEPLILDPLLRGLAATGQRDEADRIIADFGTRHALAPWMLDRLRADTRLDAHAPATLRDAATRLTTLAADESLPLVHRAEIWYNLGTAHDRLGDRTAAVAAFERAAALNPFLDAAREALTPSPT